jgi:release factor glutamine methyltransferase
LIDVAAGTSIGAARRLLADAFRRAGLDSPDLDARILVGHALGFDHAGLASRAPDVLNATQAETISALAARRLGHEPVARILCRKEFWGLTLTLGAATLVPRPETETVVEAALAGLPRQAPLRVLDLGTGTGALLLALLTELPQATGVGTDISLEALVVARINAQALGLSGRAGFVACNLASALREPFDLVVSNPPYIPRRDLAGLAPEVRDHDPVLALDGGPDGLDCYRAIATQAPRLLAPGGRLAVELGIGQAPAVRELFAAGGLHGVTTRNDLAGIPRALVACPAA